MKTFEVFYWVTDQEDDRIDHLASFRCLVKNAKAALAEFKAKFGQHKLHFVQEISNASA